MAEFEPITTQEALDNVIKDRINRLNEKHAKEIAEKYGDYDSLSGQISELKKQNDDLSASLEDAKSKLSNHDTEIAERDARIKSYETKELKTNIAHEFGLSYDAIDFLKGENEEDIKNSAEALKSLVGKKTAPLATGEGATVNNEKASYKEMLSNLF